ncbi:MAG: hypothetical protein ABS41_06075 [Arenimonas sp. SCN 70-307]|uniref:CopL family metal-binding regulatory protein n=1 Tax=Arenimonas sp. SCN 70-307 TaxID=1660089 RepID=UPI00086A2049|nr:CopL family metal-binding regulatory protein [Arenimonas sp. SCN 70-307]ODS63405.1 MAG: hypothetical protein ABS41_06075 [Arenimonas sp. SCN 70-307]
MSLLRTVGHLLLALALIANAGLPSVASAVDHAAHQSAEVDQDMAAAGHSMADGDMASCHDEAAVTPVVPSPDSPLDCCDGGTWTCSCLHHAPVVVITDAPWAVSPYRWVAQLGRLASVPAAPSAPAIRPPIA